MLSLNRFTTLHTMSTSMATTTKNRKLKSSRSRYIEKSGGLIKQRATQAGRQRFAVISVDCAKRRSKGMLSDFYGRIITESSIVEHTAGAFKAMITQINDSLQANKLTDSIAAGRDDRRLSPPRSSRSSESGIWYTSGSPLCLGARYPPNSVCCH